MTLQCIIIDDEPLARTGLKEYIQDVEFLQLAGEFDTPMKAIDLLMQQKIDLIFLDIQMPRMTGLEFLKTLTKPPLVIFTTAYPQYAVEGFELNAIDYLLKPFSFERFLKAAIRAKSLCEPATTVIATGAGTEPDYFFIKSDNKLIKVKYEEILFIEALQNYVAVHTTDKKYITYLTFRSIEEYLPAGRFVRTHKSFIVAAAKVESIEGNDIRIGQHHIPISRTERETVLQQLLQNRLLKR
ncbi:LytTR family DNA-binding domain-containing protein [Paraflavitalea speifideaquila]|uniref:LytR/AlgR family response regulator transcription factor n=1 Tax=Paraflavitalea speifideaquila TaxID=3076558 RepID=UPI0028EC5433|nr:LytTR family DNA-binding domain-containing protein [Paraflavitalea speifideiaquila]